MIAARLVPEAHEEIPPGEAVAGMILQGLGFAQKPWPLTPPFFANTPLDLLVRAGVHAERCKRFQRGRTLDAVHASGGARVVSEVALVGCAQERMAHRLAQLDTPSCARHGDDVPESDAPAMCLTHGSAKDERPDLPQAVVALLGSHEGGVPLGSTRWDGHASETPICKERAEALMTAVARAPTPRSLGADATLSTEDTATTLATLGFITRRPGTSKLVSPVIPQALPGGPWPRLDQTTRSDRLAWCHDGRAQRWLVVASPAAMARAAASLTQAQPRAWDAIEKPLLPWHAHRFAPPALAHAALTALANVWRDQPLHPSRVMEPKRSAGQGRPTPTSPRKAMAGQRHAQVRPAQEVLAARQQPRACVVIGTHIPACQVSEAEVIRV
jgi:Domain of unknown function (DUF4277)